ncbi:TIGR02147 family protein [Bdellovibrio sp. HCB337]|uniref:TIGR02147 family protein n=1 Tax=Bdellovibrio sp. HCB337 TaxID=3394358 RepID=UPI0039A5D439
MKTTPSETSDFRIWLQQQFTDRCKRNPRYSLRAFAQLLKMDASSLSQIFAGKRKVSTKVITSVCEILGSSPEQQELFIKKAKSKFKYNGTADGQDSSYEVLSQDAFKVISDWYHFAILELINVDGFQGRAAWCAKALNITTAEAQIALERLERLSLIRQEDGQWVRTNKLITNFAPGVTSVAHKHMQRQILQMALDAIDTVHAEEKDITCMTMAIDIEKIPQARKIISKFRRDLSAYLEEGAQSRVYQLAIQLYPVSKEIKS